MPTIDINLVLLIAAFTWHYALRCGYISDDHAAVAQRMDIIPDSERVDRKESFWVKRFNDGIVMFYQTRFFWLLGLKDKPFFWHLSSLAVHVLNTYLFYVLLLPILGYKTTLFACAFWAINPMLNQNVVWISGRPYLYAVCFSLIAMICWSNPLVFIPFYLLAIVTNISIFFIPVISCIIHPDDWQPKLYLAILFFAAFPFLAWKFHKRFTCGLIIDRDNFKFRLRKFNVLVKIQLYYIWTLFFPVRMGWYHQAGFRYNERWEKFNYMTLIAYTVFFVLMFCKISGWWFILGILPNSNIYATNSFLQDRYLYFCSMGIAMLVASALVNYPEIFYCVMTFYCTRAYMYSRNLKNDEALYRENWRNHPQSDYAVNNLSYFLIQQRRFEEARVVAQRGLFINQANRMLWYNLGITYAAQGHFQNDEGKFCFIRALECWKRALQLEPRWDKPANDIKKIVSLLVENKVLTLHKDEAAPHGIFVQVPNFSGLQEMAEKASVDIT